MEVIERTSGDFHGELGDHLENPGVVGPAPCGIEGGIGHEVGLLTLRHQLGAALLELVGDELEEDQREHDVLVFRGLDAAAELVGGVPEGFLEGFRRLLGCLASRLFSGDLFCYFLRHGVNNYDRREM